jgi:hypothetical protein
MANTDYIPGADAEFNTWQQNFITSLTSNKATFGLSDADLGSLTAAQTEWTDAYTGHTAAQAAASGAQQTKKAARQNFENVLRAMARRVQGHQNTEDKHRAALGLHVRAETRASTSAPTTRPVASVDTSQRLRHTIKFTDEAMPGSTAKPDGVLGCEIWVKVGSVPADPSELHFLGLDTRTPYVAEYGGEDGGKTAYYMLRWVNSKGEQGPWSQTVSATITG